MKKIKRLICIIMPIIIMCLFVQLLNLFLEKKIDFYFDTKEISILKNQAGNIVKDKGIEFQEEAIGSGDILVQGSSELAIKVPEVVSEFYPIHGFNYTISTVGRPNVQTLAHSSILGGFSKGNKNIVLLLSLQWFAKANGLENNNFQATFSPVQFYAYLKNKDISEINKYKYARRMQELLYDSEEYKEEYLYAKLYTEKNIGNNLIKGLLTPYYVLRNGSVTLKDKGMLYNELKKLPNESQETINTIDWDAAYKKATGEGEKCVSNNKFMMYNDFYDKNIKDNLDMYKDCDKNVDLLNSKEYEDYELYLDTCDDLKIRPYIVLLPTNGLWYDYTGLTKHKRDAFYEKVQKMAEEKGFDVLNLSTEEYTPYFMYDSMHLGWRGWLRIDKEIYNYYTK